MNSRISRKHNIDAFSTLLLFGLYVLFLLFLLLFGAGNYKAAVQDLDTANNLYTASSYIATKFRQHDQAGSITLENIQGTQTLCLQETINQKHYVTYIYFWQNSLKELFTASDSQADLSMGTTIAVLSDFQAELLGETIFHFTLTDENGQHSSFFLHAGTPSSDFSVSETN